MEIARYTIGTSIVFPKGEIARFDGQLKSLEAKMKASSERMKGLFNLRLNSFSVNQRGLDKVLGNALDIASNRTSFHIEHFVVDQTRLNRALTAAMVKATVFTDAGITLKSPRREGSSGSVQGPAHSPSRRVGGGIGIYGGLSRLLGPAAALAAGGYGAARLNQRNQEVVSAQLQSQAVVQQAGGTAEQGQESFRYLRQEGNRIGFNYLEASGDYNKLISGLTGSGIGLKESQKVFSGFAELARVNKLDKTTQNRLFRALSQVAGKGKLMSEELTGQIAEALPGGTALFAQAYQTKIKGNKTGSEAIQQLLADMKKGLVTSDILTYAGDKASEQANKGGALSRATQASQSQANLAQNALTDLAIVGANSGIEEGFARIFRTITAGLSESNGLVRNFAEGFNEATKWAEDLLLFPQSFVRALEGRDSLVADWLGIDKSAQLRKDWQDIKVLWDQMSALNPSNLFGQFLPTLEASSRELAKILNAIAEFQRWKDAQAKPEELRQQTPKTYDQIEKIDPFGFGSYTSPAGIFGAAWDNTFVNLNNARVRGNEIRDPNSIFYGKPEDYDTNQRNMAMDRAENNGQPIITQQFDISINIDPVTMANMNVEAQAEDLGRWFRSQLENAAVNFPSKE